MIFGKQRKRVRGCAEKLHSDSNDIVVRGNLPLFRKGYIRIGWFLGLSCHFLHKWIKGFHPWFLSFHVYVKRNM